MPRYPFLQVDVFGSAPLRGNPVAVVLDAEGLDAATMQRLASWTNLSETTFVLPPTHPDADYRLRIFTPGGELPFAGHPTLGSAHARATAAGSAALGQPGSARAQQPARAGVIVQECGVGLVEIRRDITPAGDTLAFRAPPLVRQGPLDDADLARVLAALRLDAADVVSHAWVDNGPGWMAVRLRSADAVLALEPDDALTAGLMIGAVGPYPAGSPENVEVRAFAAAVGVREDPVTGSLNAALAPGLVAEGVVPPRYRAGQGRHLGRAGIVTVTCDDAPGGDAAVWVGGTTVTCVAGTLEV
jgi:PhzF family phenazine biosynthesis protein